MPLIRVGGRNTYYEIHGEHPRTPLLLLQGISEFLKCLHALRTGQWLGEHRSMEQVISEEEVLPEVLPREPRK